MLLVLAIFLVPLIARAALYATGDAARSWRTADWGSTGTLPAAKDYSPARLVVFAGATGAWKGIFSVHSWVVYKRAGETRWTRYDVVGWGTPVRQNGWPADGRWYGNAPATIVDVSGPEAEAVIPKVESAVREYAYGRAGDYRIWPGPNSNSFTAAVLRAVPELKVTLPANAVGRDFRDGFYAGWSDSGTGVELNAYGIAGIKVGWIEGFEVNLLGLVAGIDVRYPAVKLPGFGRIGISPPVTTALAG
jgi:hypothetical protein